MILALIREPPANPLRRGGRSDVRGIPALHDGAVEQSLGARHRKQRGSAHAAGRLSEDGDLEGIAAKGRYVVPHPFERGNLIEQAQIGDAVAQIKEALSTHGN